MSSSHISNDATVLHCDAFTLPQSALLNERSVNVLLRQAAELKSAQDADESSIQQMVAPDQADILDAFYQSDSYQQLRNRYQVDISTEEMDGVGVEIFNPGAGVPDGKVPYVLINLHGGGFYAGSRTNSHLESVPVAALGRIKVVSVDYRMYPEHCFPAATDDAVAVYQALLKEHAPENIGVFGTSAGATLCAQMMVRLQECELPLPRAVAMIAAGATDLTGDSVSIGQSIIGAQMGIDLIEFLKLGYYNGADMQNPQVNPVLSEPFMAGFPPSFCASSTRDFLLSSVVATHRKLEQSGVDTELHIWEGLDHFFHANSELPETIELHNVMLRFFTEQFQG
ncbi:alpha/beta hydrolase [Porticoccaceae bacterium]|nr:alpha/beta hydrolase [Porticoccaceae bacterium]